VQVIASGVRNSVGFDFDPNGTLFFADEGGDWLGDDLPPDEVNYILASELNPENPDDAVHFGFPYCYGEENAVYGPAFNPSGKCDKYRPALRNLGPHCAALGVRVYEPSRFPDNAASLFPDEFHGKIIVAEHGSWNRRVASGYRLTTVSKDGGEYKPFLGSTGFLSGGSVCGRPVDFELMPDGSMLLTDDWNGQLFRISYAALER
jgi:glucose/arabinose dehydrogenase